MPSPQLHRSRDDRVIAGVCAGLADHIGAPVPSVRIGMLLLAAVGGVGALFYLWLWGMAPLAPESDQPVPLRRALTRPATQSAAGAAAGSASRPAAGATALTAAGSAVTPPQIAASPSAPASVSSSAPASATLAASAVPTHASNPPPSNPPLLRWPIAELLLGLCLVATAACLVLARLGMRIDLEVILPATAVLVGVGLTWWQIADRGRAHRTQLPRVLGALALVAVGVLLFFVTSQSPSVWTVITAAVAVLAGVALAISPWLLRINRELIAERAGHARATERAEIAAHLHDSVLQTLALIQQQSDPSSEVARIARRQERELREWLFRTADGAPAAAVEAVDTELRAHAAELETHHSVRFDVVSVGASGGFVAPATIVAAAKEAMVNAAQHAGGDVTVYLEIAPDRVIIDVTDRGPGLDLDSLPAGRMGVQESILGRMERAGGIARILAGPGGAGTAVRLSIPRDTDTDQRSADRATPAAASDATSTTTATATATTHSAEQDAP
ncbi:signal transduction histidine kinase/phage shock protein PspC (stress-responsive transcriptional regulator) [Leucobacter exalbidus]|uniref:Signal transduction histidine kinase/phage shock protein PspC (Stress-responsive transcriptional regulator) n=1 Tax=Leucobacter exalbidus TaxID=662960 RepID=A0A940PPV5_9MICO|nr:ATP-binding protein [Leucobacter exalbidus]MBP1325414.1 signal transduction histidine kinase/phage shock protein PspC (stress-responsive transcriptional regulator) [Leucobacter exalbidus]